MKAMRCWRKWAQMVRSTGRWGAVALAAFYLNFLAVHLATEMHFHGEEHSYSHSHSHVHADAGHDDEHEHPNDGADHTPHHANEHSLDVAFKGSDPAVSGALLAIASESLIVHSPALLSRAQLLFERERPPGESPPDPQQPRAPPLV